MWVCSYKLAANSLFKLSSHTVFYYVSWFPNWWEDIIYMHTQAIPNTTIYTYTLDEISHIFKWRCQVLSADWVALPAKVDVAYFNTLSFAPIASERSIQLLFRFSSKIVPYPSLLYVHLLFHLGRTFALTVILFCLLKPVPSPHSWTKFSSNSSWRESKATTKVWLNNNYA